MSRPKEIFLSHSSADAALSLEVAETLVQHGLPVWYAPTNIVGSQQWQDEIGRALDRCDWFIVALSPAAVESMWVRREVSYVLFDERYNHRITPILLQDCQVKKLSWVLPSIQWVDFTRDKQTAYRELLRVWGLGYQDQSAGPFS